MDRPSAKRGAARVAVVGAPTPDGALLREALAGRGVPGDRVDLYGATGGEVLLSEYDGEARIIQDPSVEEIAEHELIFICERGDVATQAASLAGLGRVVIDVVGAVEGALRPRRVHLDLNPEDARNGSGCLAIAHPVGSVLAELLAPLDAAFGVAEAVAVVLCPASDFGEPGIEELREQTVRLLSFAAVPVETFGRQLAFNVIPRGSLPAESHGVESRIAADVGELLGWQRPKLSVRLITVPLFYGHGLEVRVRFDRAADRDEVARILERFEPAPRDGEPCTPLEVTGSVRVRVAEIVEDGLGGYWMWVVAGETGARGASEAVRLAAELADL